MILLFLAVSSAVAAVVERSWIERVVIIASAVPIAAVANTCRIAAVVLLHETVGGRWGDLFGHELAGWLMMPLALGLLWVELKVISKLLVDVDPTGSLPWQGATQRLSPVSIRSSRSKDAPSTDSERRAALAPASCGD
jgi:exosortase/archaeosortase family protein